MVKRAHFAMVPLFAKAVTFAAAPGSGLVATHNGSDLVDRSANESLGASSARQSIIYQPVNAGRPRVY